MADHLPADSDVDLRRPPQRGELARAPGAILGSIAVGGAIGASARYALGVAFPAGPTGFPWATFGVNVLGCLLIGALMVVVTGLEDRATTAGRVRPGRRLVRPFLGVGVLGGFTTFSTYVVEIRHLFEAGAVGTALAYLAGTLATAVPATGLGMLAARWLRHRLRSPEVTG